MAKQQFTKSKNKTASYDKIVLSLQGGGALGSYQAGVISALQEANYQPDWVIGTSIGAINAAIFAGNSPKDRADKLHAFWNYIATPDLTKLFPCSDSLPLHYFHNALSALLTLLNGQNGFFYPRYPSPLLGLENSSDKISFYDTSALCTTLERFVDFDRINSGETQLSVGAVEASTGEITYFDNTECKIGPEHIMASGALPPGFPAVEIDGKFYWDGGLSSNSPFRHFIYNNNWHGSTLCFLLQLFDSYSLLPQTLDEVLRRKKDIEFCSHFLQLVDLCKDLHCFRYTISELANLIPEEKKDVRVKAMIQRGAEYTLTLVRFLRRSYDTDLSSKDYEFSRCSIMRRLKSGYSDAERAVKQSSWLAPVDRDVGVAVYDMTHPPLT